MEKNQEKALPIMEKYGNILTTSKESKDKQKTLQNTGGKNNEKQSKSFNFRGRRKV